MSTTSSNAGLVDVISGKRQTLGASVLRGLARCVEPIYAKVMTVRNRRFDTGKRAIHRAHVPVISIGNITTGGTGKTPMVICIAQLLIDHGHHPAIVLRGYKADRHGASDEAELIRAALPGAGAGAGSVVVVNADRAAAAAAIEAEHPQVDVIVLDDAFQHRRIARDFDLVLIDATNPFGYGHVLPRGLLREPLEGLARASAIVVTRADQIPIAELDQLDRRIAHYHGREALAACIHHWRHTLDADGQHAPTTGAKVFAFCGVGNPAAFLHQVEGRLEMAGAHSFADHHDYDASDVEMLNDQAQRRGATAMITTEKDWVKLRRVLESRPSDLPIWRAHLAIEFQRGHDALTERVLGAAAGPTAQDSDERPD